ncbi:MAG TPA: tetratricopeptide repeat protein [Beijerinckiaceae bacterium]|jgi:TolB-like protein
MPAGRPSQTESRICSPQEAEAARAALARVVASEPFRNAPRLVAFLTFVVGKTLAGEAAALKGYTIATQALGRPDDFDPQADPIVRVEAGRLRRALQAFYEGEGAADPVRIAIPVGSYGAVFEHRPETPAAPAAIDAAQDTQDENAHAPGEIPASAKPTGTARRGASLWIGAATAAAVLVLAAGWGLLSFVPPFWPGAEPDRARALGDDGRPVVVVLPLRTVGHMPDGFSPAAVRSIMADALAQFDGLTVLDQDLDRPLRGREHYDLKLRAARHGEGVHVTVRLMHQPSRQLVWSREFEARMDLGSGSAERHMARAIGVAVGQPYGVIFSDLRARAPAGSDAACLILAHDARFRVSEEEHARVRHCLEAAVAANPSYALGHALLTGFYLMEHKAGLNPRPDPLDRALRSAQRAVGLAPQSARAHFAMMSALFTRGETEAALREGHLSIELNPYNSDLKAELGARYVQLGRYPEGLALLNRAIEDNPGRPPWYDFFKFVAAYMEGDIATARAIAATLVGDTYFYGPLARGLIAYRDGDETRAKAFLDKAADLVPRLMGDLRGAFQRYGFCPAITDRFIADLGEAGLKTAAVPGTSAN